MKFDVKQIESFQSKTMHPAIIKPLILFLFLGGPCALVLSHPVGKTIACTNTYKHTHTFNIRTDSSRQLDALEVLIVLIRAISELPRLQHPLHNATRQIYL
jgi:hypothetical protein